MTTTSRNNTSGSLIAGQVNVVNIASKPVRFMHASVRHTVPIASEEAYTTMSAGMYEVAMKQLAPLRGDTTKLCPLRIIHRRKGETWEAAAKRVLKDALRNIDAEPTPPPAAKASKPTLEDDENETDEDLPTDVPPPDPAVATS